MFIVIWRYKIKSEHIFDFESLYSENGDWVKLFKRYDDYLKTELLKDCSDKESYITIDYWKSKGSYQNFKRIAAKEINEIDKLGEKLTLQETYLGEIESD